MNDKGRVEPGCIQIASTEEFKRIVKHSLLLTLFILEKLVIG